MWPQKAGNSEEVLPLPHLPPKVPHREVIDVHLMLDENFPQYSRVCIIYFEVPLVQCQYEKGNFFVEDESVKKYFSTSFSEANTYRYRLSGPVFAILFSEYLNIHSP